MIAIVALTGGPCAGKSTILPVAKQWLEERGCAVAVLSETATELITAGFTPSEAWMDELDFQDQLLQHQLARENRYVEMLFRRKHDGPRVLLCDRGALDGAAYIGRAGFASVSYDLGLTFTDLLHRYDLVIHLVTAANGAPAFYTTANNAARRETIEEAALIDIKTQAAWLGHTHLTVIDNSTDFAGKIRRALNALARKLHIPEPLEIERKFLVHQIGDLPDERVVVEIEQTYLHSPDNGERRVRRRVLAGTESYFYTEKRATEHAATRIEHERQITAKEYQRLLEERDPTLQTIHKMRHCFVYGGRHFELDIYGGAWTGLGILEVEVQSLDEDIDLPGSWIVDEVTGIRDYANHTLAGRLD